MSEDSSNQVVLEPPKSKKFLWFKRPSSFGGWAVVIATAFIIFFVSQLVAAIVVASIGIYQGQPAESITDWLTNTALAQFGYVLLSQSIAVGLVIATLNYRRLPLSVAGLGRPSKGILLKAIIAIFVFYALLIIISKILFEAIPQIDTEQEQNIGFTGTDTSPELMLAFISLVILAPIGEEVLMRGYLYGGLRARFSFITAGLVTSGLFGLAHLGFGNGEPLLWIAGISTFVLSLVLVYLREKTGTIWAGVLVHALNNLVAYLVRFHASLF